MRILTSCHNILLFVMAKNLSSYFSTRQLDMENSVLKQISTVIPIYFEGWRNGKVGAIIDEENKALFRFIETYREGGKERVKYENIEDNPIVCVGIFAYWLKHCKHTSQLARLSLEQEHVSLFVKEMFDTYTKKRLEDFKNKYKDDPNTWNWDWEYEFYAKYIIPHEIKLNKMSEALFDYIYDSDIALVRAVMNNYIKYLKKCRVEKGYNVSPELMVLRAVDSQDDTKYEDLEDYEVNTILDKLEGEGYIKVAWISGHRPEATRMLDKGRAYLKHLEEREDVIEKKFSVRDLTWEDEKQFFKNAVLTVMKQKKGDGSFLFEKSTQWIAVYRFAVDKGIMYDIEDPRAPEDYSTPQYAVFEKFTQELQFDVNPPTRLPFKKNYIDSIKKENYVRYNTRYPWSKDGITDPRSIVLYEELENVYKALEEEYYKLVSQTERFYD